MTGKEKDRVLERRVQEALAKEKDFSGYDLNTRVVDGEVNIYGIVDTLADKEHAERVVSAVEGVRKLENDLTVSTDGAVDDRQVYMEVRQELDGDPRLQGSMIKLQVHKGNVTLSGQVENAALRAAAAESAGKAMGVKKIINNIQVDSK
jgi:hyperosmotically inducible protein